MLYYIYIRWGVSLTTELKTSVIRGEGPPGPARPQKRTQKIRPDCLQALSSPLS